MPTTESYKFFILTAMAAMVTAPVTSQAATVEIDGTTVTSLAAAVESAQTTDDGPHVINITIDALPAPDGQVLITEPMTINGDADGNGVACDILADTIEISKTGTPDLGLEDKCYIEIQSVGDVTINDLQIHPNEDGRQRAVRLVDGIRMNRPMPEGIVTYTLNRVKVSGSDADLNYLPLDTDEDLFNTSGTLRWSRQKSNQSRAVIQLTKGPAEALGRYDAVLNNCHVGLGKGPALSIPAEEGTFTVNGGVFGHCEQDGIRITGETVTLAGTPTDRIRIIRATNVAANNGHAVEIEANAHVALMEYIDTSTINTGNMFVIRGTAIVDMMRYCRAIGNQSDTANATVFHSGSPILTAENCTFVGDVTNNNPLQFSSNFDGIVSYKDCIFTSTNLGTVLNGNIDSIGSVTFENCALPTDNEPGESLATPAITVDPGPGGVVTETSTVAVSPQYLLTKVAYDWSDEQGALDPLNGPGNANVLRPSNPAYLTAASDGGPLVGGAGALDAGIDSSLWMMME